MHNDRPLDWIGVVKEVAQLRCVELPTRTAIEHRSATSGVMAAECAQEFNRALAPTNPGPIALAFDPKQGYARRAAIEFGPAMVVLSMCTNRQFFVICS